MKQTNVHTLFNVVGLVIICMVLLAAFYLQFTLAEIPCPLCLLQRVCFVAIGIGLCLNIRFGAKDTHYGLIILSCVVGFSISLRQVFLHLGPYDPGYGSPFLGLYLYAWSAIAFMVAVSLCGIALLFEKNPNHKKPGRLLLTLIGFFSLVVLANAVMAFIECGPGVCPANPVNYYYSPFLATNS